ncbi:MAG: hypothetical protein HQK52_08110 [Oligoflexia bacterium]|nr:hypothetical protein [Oligoflexia bacterium]
MNNIVFVLFLLFCANAFSNDAIDRLDKLKSQLRELKKYEAELKDYLSDCGKQKNELAATISNLDRQKRDCENGANEVTRNLIRLRIKKTQHQVNVSNLEKELKEKREVLAKLLQERHILQNKKAALMIQDTGLSSAAIQLQEIYDSSMSLQKEIDETLSFYDQISSSHQEWLDNLLLSVEKYVPEFNNIVDLESFFLETKKINLFRTSTPNESNILEDKKQYFEKIRVLDASLSELQEKLALFAGSTSMASLREKKIDEGLLESLKEQDIKIHETRISLAKSKIALDKLQMKRGYLSFTIPGNWNKLAEARISASSLSVSATAIASANNALNSSDFYFKIKTSLDKRQFKTQRTFREKYCPRLARIYLEEAKKYLSDMNSILPGLHLDSILLGKTVVLLKEYERSFDIYESSIVPASESSGNYFKERKRRLTLKMEKSEKLNDECKDKIKMLIEKDEDTLDSERAYVQIVENC